MRLYKSLMNAVFAGRERRSGGGWVIIKICYAAGHLGTLFIVALLPRLKAIWEFH